MDIYITPLDAGTSTPEVSVSVTWHGRDSKSLLLEIDTNPKVDRGLPRQMILNMRKQEMMQKESGGP
jgi:hypothetical protein